MTRYSIDEPVVYVKEHGEWVKMERLPPYTILEVTKTDTTIEALAIDAYVALAVCRETSTVEDARPYAVRLKIRTK
nr:hypothetical protein [Exiguobacterium sp. s122]